MPLTTDLFFRVFEQLPILEFVSGRALKEWRDGDLAAALGHVYILENQPRLGFTENALLRAVRGGHTSAVQWLLRNKRELCAVNRTMLDAAVLGGHADVLKLLIKETSQRCSPSAVGEAAARGYVEVVDIISTSESRIGDDYKRIAMLKHCVTALRARNRSLERRLRDFEESPQQHIKPA